MGIYIYIYITILFSGVYDGYWWYTGFACHWWILMIYRVGNCLGISCWEKFWVHHAKMEKKLSHWKKMVVRCPMVSWVSLLWIESSIDLSFFTPPINRPIFNGSPWGNQMYQRMGILITGLYPAIIEWGCNWRYMGCLLKWMICDMWDQNGRHVFFTTNNWEIIGICVTSFSQWYT